MWYTGMAESPFEASATGRAMAKGRSRSLRPDDQASAASAQDAASTGMFRSKRARAGSTGQPSAFATYRRTRDNGISHLPAAYAFSRYRFLGDKHLFFSLSNVCASATAI